MITMKQIAAELNLSRSTVSYALTNRWQAKRIPIQTRTRVLTKAHELGYRPNHVARSLKTRVTKTIGVLVPTIAGEFIYQMLRGVEAVMGERYTFLLGVSEWEAARERKLIESFEERMVDGVLALSSGREETFPVLKRLQRTGVAMVQIEHAYPELHTDVVESDNERLGAMLTEHLLELGHRHIYFLRSPRVHSGTLGRAAGYERAMRSAGLVPRCYPQQPVYAEGSRFDFGRAQADAIVRDCSVPCGIITNDIAGALAALEAIESTGLRCPRDVSICTTGFTFDSSSPESLPLNRFLRLRFTTAEWSIEELGRQAAAVLLQRLQQGVDPLEQFQKIVIPARLVRGDSTASPLGPQARATEKHKEIAT